MCCGRPPAAKSDAAPAQATSVPVVHAVPAHAVLIGDPDGRTVRVVARAPFDGIPLGEVGWVTGSYVDRLLTQGILERA